MPRGEPTKAELLAQIEKLSHENSHLKQENHRLNQQLSECRFSRADFEQAISSISSVIWKFELDDRGKLSKTYISPTVDQLVGVAPGTVGHDWHKYYEYIHPDDKEGVRNALQESIAGLKSAITKYRLVRPNGEIVWVLSSGFVRINEHGIIEGFGTAIDITERQRVEAELQESKERYYNLVNNSPVAIVVHSAGKAVFVNKEAVRVLKATGKEELLGRNVLDFVHPDDRGIVGQRTRLAYQKNQVLPGMEERFLCLDGSVIDVEVMATNINFQGKPASQVVFKDISDRKKAETRLIESEERLRTLINAVPDIICFKDGHGRWLLANEADLKLFQLDDVDYHLKTDKDLAEYSEFYRNAFLTCSDTDEIAWKKGILTRGEEVIPTPDQGDRIFDIVKLPLFFPDGKRKGLIVWGRDVTESHRAQQDLQQSEIRNRAILEAIPDLIFLQDREGRYVDFIALTDKNLAFPPQEFLGKKVSELDFPESMINTSCELFQRVLDTGQLQMFEYELTDEAHGRGFYEARLVPCGTDQVLTVVRDITERKMVEIALRESEERFRTVVTGAPIVMYIIDREGKFILSEGKGLAALGLKPGQVVGMSVYEIYKDIPQIPESIQRTLAGEAHSAQVPVGDLIFDAWYSPLRDHNEQIIGVIGVATDITERIRAEEAIKNIVIGVSSEMGERFFELMVVHLAQTLRADYVFVAELKNDGHPSAQTIAVYGRDQILPNICFALHNTPCHAVLERQNCVFADNVAEAFPGDALIHDWAIRGYIAVPLIDSHQSPVGIMAVLYRQPVSRIQYAESVLQIFAARTGAEIERMRAEKALNSEKERLAVTLRSIGDGVITTDTNGYIEMMNPIAEKMTGWTQDEARGLELTRVFQIVNEKSGEPVENPVELVLRDGVIVNLANHTLLITKDGSKRAIADSGAPIMSNDGEIRGVVLVFRDETEARRLKQAKINFTNAISHELRTPLTPILGFAEMIRDSDLTPEDRELCIRQIIIGVEREVKLVDELLSVARLESGSERYIFSEENAYNLFNDMVLPIKVLVERIIWDRYQTREFKFSFEVERTLSHVIINVDRDRISQSLENLVTNAVKYSLPNRLHFQITAKLDHPAENPGQPGRVVVTIIDQGVGIPEDEYERIFDPYYQVRRGNDDISDGIGQGLAITRRYIEKHGGFVTVESRVNVGSTFKIWLPVSKLLDKPRPLNTILLVEDDVITANFVKIFLERKGYQLIVASRGETAMEMIDQALPDLIILDLQLPDSDGLDVIKRLEKQAFDIPILICSAQPEEKQKKIVEAHSLVKNYLVKPFSTNLLLQRVREMDWK